MKKHIFCTIASVIIAASIFTSCQAKPDKFGIYDDFDTALNVAQSKNMDILFTVTISDSTDDNSAEFLSNVLKTEAFKEYAKKSFICVNLDFSEARYESAYPENEVPANQQKAVDKMREKYERDMKFATVYSIETIPSVLLLSKEGYVIYELPCDSSIIKPEDFISLIESEKENIDSNKNLYENALKGSPEQQLEAIDNLYESTPGKYKLLLGNQIKRFIELDSGNKTRKLSKYLIAAANIDGQNSMLKGDVEGTLKAFEKITSSEFTSADEKQQAYFICVHILMQANSSDIDRMLDLTQKAYDCNPQSQLAPQIQMYISMLQSAKEEAAANEAGAAQPSTNNSGAGESGTSGK